MRVDFLHWYTSLYLFSNAIRSFFTHFAKTLYSILFARTIAGRAYCVLHTSKTILSMIKVVSLVLLIAGVVGLIIGVLGIFGRDLVAMNPWALAILGVIFFTSGIGLMKRQT